MDDPLEKKFEAGIQSSLGFLVALIREVAELRRTAWWSGSLIFESLRVSVNSLTSLMLRSCAYRCAVEDCV
jgi:hypothetical protein